jgi:hypothetical protein
MRDRRLLMASRGLLVAAGRSDHLTIIAATADWAARLSVDSVRGR